MLAVHTQCAYTWHMVKTPNRNIRIDDELWERATVAAQANRETVSSVIRRALLEYVKESQKR